MIELHGNANRSEVLVGVDHECRNSLSFRICEAEYDDERYGDWYEGKHVIRVEMSPEQFCNLMAQKRTPCTISYRQGVGSIKAQPVPSKTDLIRKRLAEEAHAASSVAGELMDRIAELIASGKASKRDLQALRVIASNFGANLRNTMPYLVSQFDAALEELETVRGKDAE